MRKYQPLYDVAAAIWRVESYLIGLKVREYIGDSHYYRMADTFARDLLLVSSKSQAQELIQKHPKRAEAFLSVLRTVRDELEKAGVPPFGAPDAPLLVFQPAALSVVEAVHEYRHKRRYLPFLLQRLEADAPAVDMTRHVL